MRTLATLTILAAVMANTAIAEVSSRQSNGRTEIFVTDEITTQTLDDVSRIIKTTRGPGIVYFDTIGGDLVAGLELGRAIRRSGFATDVGGRSGSTGIAPGKCHSVCTMSYAGGHYRYLQPSSQLGVHRFYRNSPGARDLDVGQVMSAAITSYLNEMDISPALFDVMVKAGRGQMLILSKEEIARFRLANFGFHPPSWVIEGKKGLVYLKGEQESFNGLGKILMSCASGGQIKVSALFNAGQNNQRILETSRNYTFRINDRFIPVDLPQRPTLSGNFILASLQPSSTLLAEIKSATHAGFAFHGSSNDTFYGFLIDKREYDDLVGSFVSHCQSFGR